MRHIIFIFVDGIGIAPEADANPFAHALMPTMRGILGGALTTELGRVEKSDACFVALDATLDMPGLPQSGTGQATLMTGENCAKLHGAHFGPYPPTKVRPTLERKNLFAVCVAHGLPIDFVNAYPQRYFEYLDAHPGLRPAIASSFLSTGRALHDVEDLKHGRAISADIVGARWHEIGHEGVEPITPMAAGARMTRLAGENAFTMFEYWLTDKAGHKQDMPAACAALELLDGMIGGMLNAMDASNTTIVLTSDHGNMEDLSVGTHTRNPVPLIVLGAGAVPFADSAVSLMDIAPRVIARLIG